MVRAAVYRFHSLIAERWRDGRVFLLGDAAHQTPPFFGQGLCHGIRDAANLSWKLQTVLAGDADPAILDSYQRERLPHARAVIEVSMRTGRYVCTIDPAAAARRDAEMRARPPQPQAELIPPLADGLLGGDTAPGRGKRFVQRGVLADGVAMRLDDAIGDGFALLATDRGSLADEAAPVRSFMIVPPCGTAEADGCATLVDRDGALAAWFDTHDCAGLILRPDRYVFGTFADAAGARALVADLARQLGRATAVPLRPKEELRA